MYLQSNPIFCKFLFVQDQSNQQDSNQSRAAASRGAGPEGKSITPPGSSLAGAVMQRATGKYPLGCFQSDRRFNDPGWGYAKAAVHTEDIRARGDKAHYELQKLVKGGAVNVEYGIPKASKAKDGKHGFVDIADEGSNQLWDIKSEYGSGQAANIAQVNNYVEKANEYCYTNQKGDRQWSKGTGHNLIITDWYHPYFPGILRGKQGPAGFFEYSFHHERVASPNVAKVPDTPADDAMGIEFDFVKTVLSHTPTASKAVVTAIQVLLDTLWQLDQTRQGAYDSFDAGYYIQNYVLNVDGLPEDVVTVAAKYQNAAIDNT